MEKEIWKDVFNFGGYYQISNLGNVKSLDRYIVSNTGKQCFISSRKIKTKIRKKDNCVSVNLNKDGIKSEHSLARILYKTFNPEFDYYNINLVIAHKDNNPIHNELTNLYIKNRSNGDELEKHKTKVKCITTEEIFNTIELARKFYKLKSNSGILSCCKGKRNYAGMLEDGTRLQWEYVKNS